MVDQDGGTGLTFIADAFAALHFWDISRFGNLVTMEWWDGIWLAESLTTFLASQRPIV